MPSSLSSLPLPPLHQGACRAAAAITAAAALAWPLLVLASLWPMSPGELLQRAGLPVRGSAWGTAMHPEAARWITIGLLVLPALAAAAALTALARGFAALAAAQLRDAQVRLRQFAAWTAAAVPVGWCCATAAGVVLTWNHGPGQRALAVGASSQDVHLLLIAVLVWTFSHLLLRAQEVAEENAQFV